MKKFKIKKNRNKNKILKHQKTKKKKNLNSTNKLLKETNKELNLDYSKKEET